MRILKFESEIDTSIEIYYNIVGKLVFKIYDTSDPENVLTQQIFVFDKVEEDCFVEELKEYI